MKSTDDLCLYGHICMCSSKVHISPFIIYYPTFAWWQRMRIGKCCDKYSIERFPKADELNVLEFLYTLNGKFIFIKEYEGILYESRGFIVAVVLKIRRYSLLV